MKYVRIDNDKIVREIIPDYDPIFPGVPITQRYAKDFLAQCLEVSDEMSVEQNWVYDPAENQFQEPKKIDNMDEITEIDRGGQIVTI